MAKVAETVTKQEAVRLALGALGPDTGAEKLLEYVKDTFGLEVTRSHLFNIKSTLKRNSKKPGRRGRPRLTDGKAAEIQTAPPRAVKIATENRNGNGRTRNGADFSLANIQAVKSLTETYGPQNLHTLVDLVAS